jgi:hypothetical protein
VFALFYALACSDPPAGALRTDRDGLAERIVFPTAATDVWWMARAAVGRTGTQGRADAQIHGWLAVGASARADLTVNLGPTMGRSVVYLPEEVVGIIIPGDQRILLPHNADKRLYRLEGERFPPEKLGRADYRGQTVLLKDDRLYVSAQSR